MKRTGQDLFDFYDSFLSALFFMKGKCLSEEVRRAERIIQEDIGRAVALFNHRHTCFLESIARKRRAGQAVPLKALPKYRRMSQAPDNENFAGAATSQPSTFRLKSPHTYAELRSFRLQNLKNLLLVIAMDLRDELNRLRRSSNYDSPIISVQQFKYDNLMLTMSIFWTITMHSRYSPPKRSMGCPVKQVMDFLRNVFIDDESKFYKAQVQNIPHHSEQKDLFKKRLRAVALFSQRHTCFFGIHLTGTQPVTGQIKGARFQNVPSEMVILYNPCCVRLHISAFEDLDSKVGLDQRSCVTRICWFPLGCDSLDLVRCLELKIHLQKAFVNLCFSILSVPRQRMAVHSKENDFLQFPGPDDFT
ncbi:unnamed protein product [Cylicocyclus nassatus]|uniref:Uncharacterized protein n=1 Tax=Cylicocyclus nassatus TaxID=53992 RepID=A0AA36GXT4_CYLNA|nr:unnamed protein product [Cylicocyclus nassatus]